MGSNLLLTVSGIHLLGTAEFGYFSMSLAVCMVFLVFNSGFCTSLTRRIIHAREVSLLTQVDRYVRAAVLYMWILIILITGVDFLMLDKLVCAFIYLGDDAVYYGRIRHVFSLLLFSILLNMVTVFLAAIAEGYGRFDLAARARMMFSVVLLGALMVFLLMPTQATIEDLAACYLLASIVEVVSIYIVVRKTTSHTLILMRAPIASLPYLKRLLGDGWSLLAAGLLRTMVDPFNKFLLNYFVGSASIAFYDLAFKAISGIRNLFEPASRAFMTIAPKAENVVRYYRRLMNLVMRPLFLLHALVGLLLMLLILSGFVDAGEKVVVLYLLVLPASLAISLVSPLYYVLICNGELQYVLRLNLILAVANIVLSSIFVPLWGLVGSGLGFLFATLYNTRSVYRRFLLVSPLVRDELVVVMAEMRPTMVFGVLLSASVPGAVLYFASQGGDHAVAYALGLCVVTVVMIAIEVVAAVKNKKRQLA